jgi:uncharacterized protein (DUF433 family)
MTSATLLARIAAEPGRMGGKLEPEELDACLLYAARLSDLAAAEGRTVAAQ